MAATEGRHRVVFTISTRLKELLSNYSDLHETTVTEVLKRLIIENCQPPPNKITVQKVKPPKPLTLNRAQLEAAFLKQFSENVGRLVSSKEEWHYLYCGSKEGNAESRADFEKALAELAKGGVAQ